jgi:hypothetical protein
MPKITPGFSTCLVSSAHPTKQNMNLEALRYKFQLVLHRVSNSVTPLGISYRLTHPENPYRAQVKICTGPSLLQRLMEPGITQRYQREKMDFDQLCPSKIYAPLKLDPHSRSNLTTFATWCNKVDTWSARALPISPPPRLRFDGSTLKLFQPSTLLDRVLRPSKTARHERQADNFDALLEKYQSIKVEILEKRRAALLTPRLPAPTENQWASKTHEASMLRYLIARVPAPALTRIIENSDSETGLSVTEQLSELVQELARTAPSSHSSTDLNPLYLYDKLRTHQQIIGDKAFTLLLHEVHREHLRHVNLENSLKVAR